MASALENYSRQRFRNVDRFCYENNSAFGQCDCTSYSYFALSTVLFAVGTVITVLALGDVQGYLFSNLGHIWLVGPIFICSGLMVAVKSVLYLRKKNLIQMLLRQRALLRELAQQSRNQPCNGVVARNPSCLTLPPSYDLLMGTNGQGIPSGGGGQSATDPGGGGAASGHSVPSMSVGSYHVHPHGLVGCSTWASSGMGDGDENLAEEAPPPTYEEAMFLMAEEDDEIPGHKGLKVVLAAEEDDTKPVRVDISHYKHTGSGGPGNGRGGSCSKM
ncbi:uncharacterized protein LOC124161547 isoform X1 [Ischnura elegans]|uniref:uncharacterized protein LOC124161547 isoform X1 n=1 Tax=Ischnura elegans TaxID=197161 RepID=UPI001ED8AA7C|nr:uncharacterized protein LOC124161547 isoform X1 [Ischnura elegans]